MVCSIKELTATAVANPGGLTPHDITRLRREHSRRPTEELRAGLDSVDAWLRKAFAQQPPAVLDQLDKAALPAAKKKRPPKRENRR